ncbi:neural proliferation differentiation and control protein 1a [Chanos chanos]|uniref:Neural proliferation differentiation and control protein 1a n=1 Tax=Chanos chanos TaxID=29144 RepID=A0A6J2V047_CHACN|nr:neural proliferation differentiation and control protein 1-like [Chanos chanos]
MLPPRRIERQPWASVLPGILLCVILASVSASSPVKCPHLDCARERRELCPPGSTRCGPCLQQFEEDEMGNCVVPSKHHQRHHHHHHHEIPNTLPDLDEEIDYLSSVIAKQQVTAVKQAASPPTTAPQDGPDGPDLRVLPPTREPNTSSPLTPTPMKPNPPKPHTGSSGRGGPIAVPHPSRDSLLLILISLCIIVGTVALIMATICWVKLQREAQLAEKVDYPAFGGKGANSVNKISSGDNKLAHSAQMYHYHHQKQQMLSMEKHKVEPKVPESGAASDEENEEGDFTVYECPGLAPTGEMEVKNPLFDDSTLQPQKDHK